MKYLVLIVLSIVNFLKNNSNVVLLICSVISLVILQRTAIADDLFTAEITTAGETKVFGFNNAKDVIEEFENSKLNQSFSGYVTDVSKADASLNFRGIPMTASFDEGGTQLTFKVESLGIDKTFVGATRKESSDELVDFLIKNGDNLRDRLAKELIAKSSTDPLAGNPSSLMGKMVASNFSQGTTVKDISPRKISSNNFGMSARFGRLNQGGKEVTSYTLPLSYSFIHESKKHKLILSLPVTYTEVQKARSYNIGLGVAWQWRATPNWSLTPAVSYGLAGSIDLASVGQIISGTLTSKYTWHLDKENDGLKISLATMGGYFQTLPMKIAGLNLDPDITNYVIKNGVMLDMPVKINFINKKVNLKAYFTDTEFFGDRVYSEQYNEVGMAVNLMDERWWMEKIGVNLSYLFSLQGDDVKGFSARFGFQF